MTDQKTLATVQAIRAIAAFWVAAFHFHPKYLEAGGRPDVHSLMTAGWVGVDVFFVLSGFIMWATTSETTDAVRFIKKRLTRIYTSLWPAVALYVLAEWYCWGDKLSIEWWKLANSITLLAPSPNHEHCYLFVTWTLTFELAFYVLFGCILWVGKRHAILCAILFLLIIELGITLKHGWGWSIPRILSDRIFYEFVLGAASAHACTQPISNRVSWLLISTSLILIGFGTYVVGWLKRSDTLLFFGFGTAILLCGLRVIEPLLRNWIGSLFVRLGDWSYATYLIHPAVCSIFIATGMTWNYGKDLGAGNLTMIYLAAVLIASPLYYHLIEVPLLALGRRLLGA